MANKDLVQFKLLVRKEFRDLIEAEANKNGRSANREAVERLVASFNAAELRDMVRQAVRDEFNKQNAHPGAVWQTWPRPDPIKGWEIT